MKITREQLKSLILEELKIKESILIEMPQGTPIVGQEQTGDYTKDPDSYGDEVCKRSLYHMSQQSQQLHDMIQGDENLVPHLLDEIAEAARLLEKVFKAIVYDKGPGQGRI